MCLLQYNETSVIPTDCSPLSDKVDFSIAVPHQIAYTKQPASGASSGVDYEYSKNVNFPSASLPALALPFIVTVVFAVVEVILVPLKLTLYYKPLEPAKGTGDYVADLTDIPEGDYKFAIVNEAYNETSVIPTSG